MTKALEKREDESLAVGELPPDPTPAQLMQVALNAGLGVEGIRELAAMYERAEARDAERQFNDALAAFQSEVPTIRKTKEGAKGYYRYAPLEYIEAVIRPYRKKHGFSHSFDMEMTANMVTASIEIRHVGGHKKVNRFSCPGNEGTSAMNALQKVGSGTSFAKRYCLTMGYGINTGDEDDDAAKAGSGETLTDEMVATLDSMLDEVKADRGRFLKWLKVEQLAEIQKDDYRKAVALLEKKRAQA